MKVTKSIRLEDFLFLEIERVVNDYGVSEKHFYLNDEETQTRQKLAVLRDCKWTSHHPSALNKLFSMAKQYKLPIIMNMHKGLELEHEITISKRIKCFKRTFKVRVTRMSSRAKRKTHDAIQNIFR
jgi:hypothetical protein